VRPSVSGSVAPDALDKQVCAVVDDLRGLEWPVERIIIALQNAL